MDKKLFLRFLLPCLMLLIGAASICIAQMDNVAPKQQIEPQPAQQQIIPQPAQVSAYGDPWIYLVNWLWKIG